MEWAEYAILLLTGDNVLATVLTPTVLQGVLEN